MEEENISHGRRERYRKKERCSRERLGLTLERERDGRRRRRWWWWWRRKTMEKIYVRLEMGLGHLDGLQASLQARPKQN